jgi:hypothetical protein
LQYFRGQERADSVEKSLRDFLRLPPRAGAQTFKFDSPLHAARISKK